MGEHRFRLLLVDALALILLQRNIWQPESMRVTFRYHFLLRLLVLFPPASGPGFSRHAYGTGDGVELWTNISWEAQHAGGGHPAAHRGVNHRTGQLLQQPGDTRIRQNITTSILMYSDITIHSRRLIHHHTSRGRGVSEGSDTVVFARV